MKHAVKHYHGQETTERHSRLCHFDRMEKTIMSKQNSEQDEKLILINQLYAGTYLKEGYNVGHGVINMIPTKNNEHYLYITPKGTIKDKTKASKVESVIFVRHISKGQVYEIVGIATELALTNKGNRNDNCKNNGDIKYGNESINAPLKDIFAENAYHGQPDITEAYTTFKAGIVKAPKMPITIYLSSSCPDNKNQADITSKINLQCTSSKMDKKMFNQKRDGTISPSKHASIYFIKI